VNEVVREWAGSVDAVRRALEIAEGRGQLVSVEPLRAGPRGVAVRVVLRPATLIQTPTAPRQIPRQRHRHLARWIAAGAFGLAGLTALLGWAIYLLFVWLAAHVAEVLGVLGALLAALWLLGRVGVCPGVHCPGCRHR